MTKKRVIDQYGFNISLQQRAKRYWSVKFLASMFKYAFLFVSGFLTLTFGVSLGLERFVLGYTSDPWLVTVLYLFVGVLCFWAVSLPFDYYKEYVIEHRFDLSTQSLGSWISDQVKELILVMVILIFIVQGIYYSLRTFPTYWWVVAWIFISLAMLVISYIMPVAIMPLFFKFPRLKDAQLVKVLANLAKKAGIEVVGVFEMKAGVKTRKAIGALTGVGNTRRIILSDTLLANYTYDEIEGVIGHELGHHVFHHIGKMIATFSVIMLVAFYVVSFVSRASVGYFGFSGIGDIASLPLFALTFSLVFTVLKPLMNGFSRYNERQADQFALETIKKPDAFVSLMTKYHDHILRDAYPHPIVELLFYDHPAGKKRVENALIYKKSMGKVSDEIATNVKVDKKLTRTEEVS